MNEADGSQTNLTSTCMWLLNRADGWRDEREHCLVITLAVAADCHKDGSYELSLPVSLK